MDLKKYKSAAEIKRALHESRHGRKPDPAPVHDRTRSGFPGPRTPRHLIEQELKRRAATGRLESSWKQQAEALAAWWDDERGADEPPLKMESIRRNDKLRALYRKHKPKHT